ncbi:hypothetical protein [Marinifilum sp.]|uniref:hypothetical protein n=1 Tax=Marinifilum sp. TaxID=2033137 RepID=UPI003BA8E72B
MARHFVNARIQENNNSLESLKESMDSESKSTAGDKHETGRAMMHIEQEKLARQLANNQKIKSIVDRINPEVKSDTVELGALIITDKIRFFVLAGLGQLEMKRDQYLLVSFQSELVQEFKGKRKGDQVNYRGQAYAIHDIL